MSLKERTNDLKAQTEIRTYKYDSHVKPRLDEIYEWLKSGYTDYSIANSLSIDHDTLIKYKKEITELSELYTRVRAEKCDLVMNSQFAKAKGIKEKVQKAKVLSDGTIINYTEEQYIPPDTNAADLYLRNNSNEYKSAKADVGGLTLIQNNYQLPQLLDQLKQIDDELKRLDIIDSTAIEIDCE